MGPPSHRGIGLPFSGVAPLLVVSPTLFKCTSACGHKKEGQLQGTSPGRAGTTNLHASHQLSIPGCHIHHYRAPDQIAGASTADHTSSGQHAVPLEWRQQASGLADPIARRPQPAPTCMLPTNSASQAVIYITTEPQTRLLVPAQQITPALGSRGLTAGGLVPPLPPPRWRGRGSWWGLRGAGWLCPSIGTQGDV